MFTNFKPAILKAWGKASNYLPPPLREVLSENGYGSYSRVSGMLVVLFTLGWVTYLVAHNHAFPDMSGPTAFLAGGQTQYAANQIKNVVSAAKGNNPTPTVPALPVVVTNPGAPNGN